MENEMDTHQLFLISRRVQVATAFVMLAQMNTIMIVLDGSEREEQEREEEVEKMNKNEEEELM